MLRRVLVLALLAAVAHAETQVPKAQWYQKADAIVLTIQMNCESNRHVNITLDTFSLTCSGADNKHLAFEFTLREDISPHASNCTSHNGVEECILLKEHPHWFDRLTRDESELQRQLSVDWTHWRSVDDGLDTWLDAYDDVLHALDLKAFEAATKKHDVVIVDIDYQWCAKCTHIKKPLIDLHKALKKKAFVGYADAREQPELRRLLQANCTHVCHVAVAKRGENVTRVEIKHELEANLRTFGAFIGPLVTPVAGADKAAVKALRKKNSVVAVGVGLDDRQRALFADAGRQLRGRVRLASAAPQTVTNGTSEPHIIFYRSDERGETQPFPGNDSFVFPLMRGCSYPPVKTFEYSFQSDLEALNLPVARIFANDEPSVLAVYEEVSKAFRGKIVFIRMPPKENMHFLVDYGLPKELPAFTINGGSSWESNKYAFEGNHTVQELTAFCNDFLAGKVTPAIRSEPVPQVPSGPGNVVTVVGRTLQSVLDSSDEFLIAFRKTWSSNLLGRGLSLNGTARCVNVTGVKVGVIDVSQNFVNETLFPNHSAPGGDLDMYLLQTQPSGTRSRIKYPSGTWGRKDLLRFLKTHSKAVQQHWDAVVAESDKITAEAKAVEAAEKSAQEEGREALAAIPRISLTNDGGVLKQIRKQGDGPVPPSGATIYTHYTGALYGGSVFDKSRDKPFTFKLDGGTVIACWNKAFATMHVGEKAVLTCSPQYAYGERGNPPVIPASATLQFEVELLSFDPPDGTITPGTPLIPQPPAKPDSKADAKTQAANRKTAGDKTESANVMEDVTQGGAASTQFLDAASSAAHQEL